MSEELKETENPESRAGETPSCCCSSSVSPVDTPPCCGPPATVGGREIDETVPGFRGWLTTAAGRIPLVTSDLSFGDRISSWKLRWGMGRMSAIVPPGLYAMGTPGPDDPVVVTANYTMSYDLVRKALFGRSLWILVLETYGVNVWCAAGKGTFGTEELVRRIDKTGLSRVVEHRRLVVPILGATGVAAHKVEARTGFQVLYAAIRAEDLPEFLNNGMVTTASMRELSFTFRERLVLIPVELLISLKKLAVVSALLFLLPALQGDPMAGTKAVIAFLGAAMGGIIVTPLLLPWLPGRSFSVKGAVVGLVMVFAWYLSTDAGKISASATAAVFCAVPAVSAFFALNFTGCTPFTSRSGVKKEMRIALPIMGCVVLLGLGLLLAGLISR